jgi:S1-C subfamily serine protease
MSESAPVFFPKTRGIAAALCAIFVSTACEASFAQTTQSSSERPLLEQLNRETQDLFKHVAPSIVRVQLPMPTTFTLPPDDPLAKWAPQLDPASLARLAAMEHSAAGVPFSTVEIRPTTEPASAQEVQQSPHLIVLRVDRFVPNGVGIVVDDQNRLLVPRYVDQAACQWPIPVAVGDGRWATASFVASDRQADLTILRLNDPKLQLPPATVSTVAPQAGTLLLVMSLNPASNRLAVWQGWEPDVATLVNIDGTIAGFTKEGRYISAAGCTPVVEELIQHGVVRRPFLGVVIESFSPDDPDRQLIPGLGATPALRIRSVIPGSAAERAGLQPEDLILTLADQSVGDATAFAAAIAERRGRTQIEILRKGQRHVVNVDLQVQK